MIRRPPRSTRTDTLFPYTTLFRSTLVPMILITESRAGIVIGAVGLVAAAAIYRRPEQGIRTRGAKQVRGLAAAGLAIAGTIVVMLLSLTSRPTTIDRLTSESVADDLRFRSEERRGGKEGVSTCRSRRWPDH